MLDLNVWGLDGEQTLKLLRETDPEARVLISSGLVSDERAEALSSMGVSGFLHKPYDAQRLRARVIEEILESAASGS